MEKQNKHCITIMLHHLEIVHFYNIDVTKVQPLLHSNKLGELLYSVQ